MKSEKVDCKIAAKFLKFTLFKLHLNIKITLFKLHKELCHRVMKLTPKRTESFLLIIFLVSGVIYCMFTKMIQVYF